MTRFTTAAAIALGLPMFAAPFLAMPAMAQDGHAAPAAAVERPAGLGIQIHDAYAFSALPNAPTAAAFMTVHNHGMSDDRLVSVSSDVAERTEIHDHVMSADGVAQMVHVAEGLPVSGHDGEVVMQRGGLHVMFMGLKQPFTAGFTFPLTLHFEQAGDVVVEVTVDPARMTQAQGDGAGHGHEGHAAADHAEHGADHGPDHAAHQSAGHGSEHGADHAADAAGHADTTPAHQH